MKIACITRFDAFYPTGGLIHRVSQEFQKRNCSYIKINPQDIRICFDGDKFPLSHPETDLQSIDIFDHSLRSDDDYAWEIVRCISDWGMKILRAKSVPFSNKVKMARIFAHAGISIPKTIISNSFAHAEQEIISCGFPVIGKARSGSQGRYVDFIENREDLECFCKKALEVAPNFLLQEVVYPLGEDLRLFVVDKKVVAAMKRFSPEGYFRANYTLSKRADTYLPCQEEVDMAVKACDVYQVNFAGVDIMQSEQGPVLIEVNTAPGLKGIEKISEVM